MDWIFQQFEDFDLMKYPFSYNRKNFYPRDHHPLRQQIASILGPTIFK